MGAKLVALVLIAEGLYGFTEADAFNGVKSFQDALVIHFLFGFHCGEEGYAIGTGALLDLKPGKAQWAFSQMVEKFSQRQTNVQFDVHIHTAGIAVKPSVPHVQESQNDENCRASDDGYLIQSDT